MKLFPELDLQRYKQEKEAGHSLYKGIHPDRFWPSAGERHGSLSAEGKPHRYTVIHPAGQTVRADGAPGRRGALPQITEVSLTVTSGCSH